MEIVCHDDLGHQRAFSSGRGSAAPVKTVQNRGLFPSMTPYSEKLRHPKWQKKRLEVLQRANWTCEACGDNEENLQVHHLIYSKGEPWDAPNNTLECLCETC